MFDGLQPWHIILLAAVFILLFGWKRLPDASRAIGRSLRIFKAEVKGLHDDEPASAAPPVATPIAAPVAAPVVTAPVASPAEAVVAAVPPGAPAAVPVTPEPVDPA